MATIFVFKQINPILGRISNQSNKAHLMWSKTFRDRISSNIIDIPGANPPALVSTVFTAYAAAVTAEDDTAIVIQKSQHTEEIEQADGVRDNTWLGIKTMAEALLRVGTEDQKRAAKRFLDSANAHNIGISQKYEIETESLRQFIQVCEGDLAADVATLGLTALIAQLKQENEAVHTLIQQRNTEAAGIEVAAMKTAREETDALYKQLVTIINAFAISTYADGHSPYDTCIDLINADIDYYDKHVFSKKKKTDGDGDDQGGSDDQGGGSDSGGGSDDQGGDDGPHDGGDDQGGDDGPHDGGDDQGGGDGPAPGPEDGGGEVPGPE